MNAIVIEHVPVAELPQAWRDKLGQAAGTRARVRIETVAKLPKSQQQFVSKMIERVLSQAGTR